ncbi:MAG: hypothetical protein U0821_16160 [Chloroflexota bacterium]
MSRRIARTLISASILFAVTNTATHGQTPQPPGVGDVVFADSLMQAGALQPTNCATGRNSTRFVEDGLQYRVTGRCTESATNAAIGRRVPGLTMTDGDIRLEFKVIAAPDRAELLLGTRVNDGGNEYAAYVRPGLGQVQVNKFTNGQRTVLNRRTDVANLYQTDTWNSVALRTQGNNLWLLLNDEVVVAVADDSLDRGAAGITLYRMGDANDDAEVSILVRNLRISGLLGSEESRLPVYAPPAQPAVSSGPAGPVLAAGTPPPVGPVTKERSLSSPQPAPEQFSPNGRCSFLATADGLRIRTTGRCADDTSNTQIILNYPDTVISDGEARVQVRLVEGSERAAVGLWIRHSDGRGIIAAVHPVSGWAEIVQTGPEGTKVAARRTDLIGRISRDDWFTVAIVAKGPEIFLLIDDKPLLSAKAESPPEGQVRLSTFRTGNVDDTDGVAALFRDLRVSQLAESP